MSQGFGEFRNNSSKSQHFSLVSHALSNCQKISIVLVQSPERVEGRNFNSDFERRISGEDRNCLDEGVIDADHRLLRPMKQKDPDGTVRCRHCRSHCGETSVGRSAVFAVSGSWGCRKSEAGTPCAYPSRSGGELLLTNGFILNSDFQRIAKTPIWLPQAHIRHTYYLRFSNPVPRQLIPNEFAVITYPSLGATPATCGPVVGPKTCWFLGHSSYNFSVENHD